MVGDDVEIQVSIKVKKSSLEWIDQNFRNRQVFFRGVVDEKVKLLKESGFSFEIKGNPENDVKDLKKEDNEEYEEIKEYCNDGIDYMKDYENL